MGNSDSDNDSRRLAKKLLVEQRIVKASINSSVAKWLDVPDGPFALGMGSFAQGSSGVEGAK